MPKTFPKESYYSIRESMVSKKKENEDSWLQFAWAWKGVMYRYKACAEYNIDFTNSIKEFGDGPPPPERYLQEKYLFGFFVSGLSTLESLLYGLYLISYFIKPNCFQVSENDLRNITPKNTMKKFKCHFEEKNIISIIEELIKGDEFNEWNDIRNMLAHRGAEGRHFYVGRDHHGKALWIRGIPINKNTTSSRYNWLIGKVKILLEEIDEFASINL